MKNWSDCSNKEKIEAYNSFIAILQNVQSKYSSDGKFCNSIEQKLNAEEELPYRDYIILWLLDKGYTVNDGFRFFNAVGLKLSQEDIFSIICEKLDITIEELLGALLSPVNISKDKEKSRFEKEQDRLIQEAEALFNDIKLRLEIFVEVHNLEFQKQNPEKYVELLNSPVTSLLSIKLSKNERITKALKKRIKAGK